MHAWDTLAAAESGGTLAISSRCWCPAPDGTIIIIIILIITIIKNDKIKLHSQARQWEYPKDKTQ